MIPRAPSMELSSSSGLETARWAAEAGYLWYFDYDGDCDVDGRDNGQFNRRFGHH